MRTRLQPRRYCGVKLLAKGGVSDLTLEVFARHRLGFGHSSRDPSRSRAPSTRCASSARLRTTRWASGSLLNSRLRSLHHRVARVGQYPRRGALKDLEGLDERSDLGDYLDGTGAGADNADPLPIELDRLSHRAVCMTDPAKSIDPVDVGQRGSARPPVARMTHLASNSPWLVVRRQSRADWIEGDVGDVVVELDQFAKVVPRRRRPGGTARSRVGSCRCSTIAGSARRRTSRGRSPRRTDIRDRCCRATCRRGRSRARRWSRRCTPRWRSRIAAPRPPKPEPMTATSSIMFRRYSVAGRAGEPAVA